MPKHVEPEYDPFEGVAATGDGSARAGTPQTERARGKRKAGELTPREQARLKKKQAVLAKMQEQAQANSARESSASAVETKGENQKAKSANEEHDG